MQNAVAAVLQKLFVADQTSPANLLSLLSRGGCVSVVEQVDHLVSGSIPASSSPYADVSLSKTLDPKLSQFVNVSECICRLVSESAGLS